MKKFSFLLIGAFLLLTMAFALAEEAEVKADTWATTEVTATETAAPEATETAAPEATEAATAEATETATAEATEAATAEATETATAETTGATPAEATETNATEEDAQTTSDSAKSKYSEEQVAAYEWALEKGITTINDIEKAKLSDWLTRAQLAKMMSQYMTNVLWKTPVDAEKVEYADVDKSLGDLADYIQTAYAYKIMWINADGTPIKKFNPNGQVTRAEYATVFSRVLFGDKYNKSEWNYYENHLNALKEAGILTNTTPTIQEIRGWVMLMMYRSSQNSEAIEKVANAEVTEETPATTEEATTQEPATEETTEATPSEQMVWMANPASVYCEEQGGTVNIIKDEEGNESGMCKLADGTEVEEWEYYRANHPETETWATTEEPTTEEATSEEPTTEETTEAWTGEVATTETSDE